MDKYIITETQNYTIMEEPVGSGKTVRKEQVYISGHPADQGIFKEIAEELFPEYHCRVFLSKNREDTLAKEELQALLQEMSLVVILVSERFLHEENPARNLVLSTARETGVRIMTVQAEKGVEAEFNRICGAYHLLNRTAADYPAQLKAYISQYVNVYRLIGLSNEQAEILDNLFSLRAFVSYRKKDHAAMRQLLNRIRSNPSFLDISIWYDNALIPGENFDDQIREEIDKADFVILVVTPCLLEEGNYVHEYEYGQAVQTGKPILPVMMEDTDEQAIKCFYHEIPSCIRGNHPSALEKALLEMRYKLNSAVPEMFPFRKYLLARAYAAGEGTEREPVLSSRLYLEAAEEGEAMAMARIGDDYYWGRGRERDRVTGITWLSRAMAKFYEQMMLTPPDRPEAVSLGKEVFQLAETLSLEFLPQKQYDRVWQYLQKQLDAAEYLRKVGMISARFNPGIVYLRMGEVCFLNEAYTDSEVCYAKAKEMLEVMDKTLGVVYSGMYMAEWAANSGRLSAVLFRKGQAEKFEPALHCLSEALDRSEELLRLPGQNDSLPLQAAQDLLDLGKTCEHIQGGMPLAMEIYRTACVKLRPLQKNSFPRLEQVFAIALCQAAIAGKNIPDKDMLEESFAILDRLCRRFAGDTVLLQSLVTVRYALSIWPHSPDEKTADSTINNRSAGSLKDTLDQYTLWEWLESGDRSLSSLFLAEDGIVQEGAWGRSNGNFRLSSYVCPHCGQPLYKVVFPYGNDPELVYDAEKRLALRPARVFASPCGRFFAAPAGRRMTEGPVLQAVIVHSGNDQQEQQLFNLWCEYLSGIGDISAVRKD